MGSPLYMSPEQMRGARDVDARADVWALGVTLYQLLANAVPFQAETLVAVVSMVNLDPPTPLRQHRPDLPPGLGAVIEQCLEKDRTRRFPDVAALAAALAPFATARAAGYVERVASVQHSAVMPSRPTTELPQPTETAMFKVATAQPVHPVAPVVATRRSPRFPRAALIGGPVIVAALVLYLGLRSHGQDAPPRPPIQPAAQTSASTTPPETPAAITSATPTATVPSLSSATPAGSSPTPGGAASSRRPPVKTAGTAAPKGHADPYAQ
jgi:serine/threonine-protein kinase